MPDTDTQTDAPQEGADDAPDDEPNGNLIEDDATDSGSPSDRDDDDPLEDLTEDELLEMADAKLRRENAKWRRKLRDAESELEKLKGRNASDGGSPTKAEKLLADANRAMEKAERRFIESALIAASAGVLQDTDDAVRNIDVEQFQVDDDGNVDRGALKAAIDDLLERKPHLRAARDPEFGHRNPANVDRDPSMDDWLRRAAGR